MDGRKHFNDILNSLKKKILPIKKDRIRFVKVWTFYTLSIEHETSDFCISQHTLCSKAHWDDLSFVQSLQGELVAAVF